MNNIILGIDISKLTFDVALLNDDKVKTKKFTNTSKGFSELNTTLHTTNKTLEKWVELQPIVERSKNNFTTIDTLKSWGGSLAVLYVSYDIIKKLIG